MIDITTRCVATMGALNQNGEGFTTEEQSPWLLAVNRQSRAITIATNGNAFSMFLGPKRVLISCKSIYKNNGIWN